MAQRYEWTPAIATAIRQLPPRDSVEFRSFLADLEEGTLSVPSEVLAFLIREAYHTADTTRADRLFHVLYERHAAQLAVFTLKNRALLRGVYEPQDVIVQVFVQLFGRLCSAEDVTFYELAFLPAMRKNTIEICARMVRGEDAYQEPREDSDGAEWVEELEDPNAVSPETRALEQETMLELRDEMLTIMRTLPANVRTTAMLIVQGRTQEEIAASLGVTSRMVRHYRDRLKHSMRELAGV